MPLPPFLKKYLNGLGLQVDVQDSVRVITPAVLPSLRILVSRSGTLVRLIICWRKKAEEFLQRYYR